MNKCPRCENENLKEEYNFCPICRLNLKMNREKALKRAIELKEHSEEFESVSFLDGDTEFFEYVIRELERTAPEVPVQEQSEFNKEISRENHVKKGLEIIIENSKKIKEILIEMGQEIRSKGDERTVREDKKMSEMRELIKKLIYVEHDFNNETLNFEYGNIFEIRKTLDS